MTSFAIPEDEVFVIAEIANAHTGCPPKLKEIVQKAIIAKPDAIKFQLFKTSELLISHHHEYDLYKDLEISDNHLLDMFKMVRKSGIKVFADVFSLQRAKFAAKAQVDGFKVHSSDVNNTELLTYLASTGKPILLSCSGCTANEIDGAVGLIKKNASSQIILMHGFQGFPTDISQIHLRRITSLRQRYELPVGYSDHIDGSSQLALYMPMIALGFGAYVIEKHITINRSLKEEDYQSSLNPDEFALMVRILKESYKSIGSPSLMITGSEQKYRKNMKKRIVARRDLDANRRIAKEDMILKRVDHETPEVSVESVVGALTKQPIKRDTPITSTNAILKRNKVVAAIACRVESTRLFAKPLQRVDEHTILDYIIMQLRQSELIDEIVLAISENAGNEIFVEYARRNNLKFVRGDDEDVLRRVISAADHVNANIVFRVTSEDPFKYWHGIDAAIEQHLQTGADFTYTKDLPEGTGFEIINLKALKSSHAHGQRRNRSELVTSYIHEHQADFKILPFEVKSKLRRPEIRFTVDYPEDLILVKTLASRLKFRESLPDLELIIEQIDADPKLKEINNKFAGHGSRIWL